jgi:hypothetical protein
VPAIIVESKAYVPDLAKEIKEPTFFVRAQEGVDHLQLADALADSAKELNIPHLLSTEALPKRKGFLAESTKAFADKLAALSESLKYADDASKKVAITAELAKLISEDAGGITFMSNELHDEARSAGIQPGSAAVLSLLVPDEYIRYWKIPVLEPGDVENYSRIILRAVSKMARP